MLIKNIGVLIENRSFFKWMLVGSSTFIIDYVLFVSIYAWNGSVVLSNLSAGIISISFNYYAHHSWSFSSNSQYFSSGLKYLLNLTFFWIFGTILLKVLIDSGIDAKFAKLLPIPVLAPLSFISLKLFVFKNKRLT